MRVPRGDLVRSRVVDDPGEPLRDALDRTLTGYAVLEPQDAILLEGETAGVLTFRDGVPVLAYERASGRGGPDALADLAGPGPYRAELYAVPADDLTAAHDRDDGTLAVPPAMPAERLAGDPALADRTRETAPDDRLDGRRSGTEAVEAFLDDDERVAAIREQARREARARADEWGLADQLDAE